MPANVSPSLLSKLRLRLREGSLLVRWLSLVSRLQLCAFLTGIVGWVMCIATTASVNWRVWRVENIEGIASGNVWIGIWAVCFWRDPSNDGNAFWHCEDLNEQYPTLPRENFYAQDLMALAPLMNSAALVLTSFALYNVFEPRIHKDFVLTFFRIGAFLNLFAGILVLISVIWNMSAVLKNGEINFPDFPELELPPIPSEQHIGPSIYVGYIAAGFQLLSAALVGIEILCFKTPAIETREIETVVVITPGSEVKSECLTTCLKCGSLLDLVIREETYSVESHADNIVIEEESSTVEIEESHETMVIGREVIPSKKDE
ncbi:claudin-34-like [Zootoca vivipara]|uniref:claudin-34-like n=1 Tax=Zootoca vivipara TaxID=8524 RepID=UPI00293B9C27|nr:claudin-34-like [Zootoca vivipara]